jgi:phosphoribosylaminoimidazole-succinocarboxamide synthase
MAGEFMNLVSEIKLPLKLIKRGKVRDIYEFDEDKMLLVATDRISAFDIVLPNLIPHKGQVLTDLSVFWFKKTKKIIENHLTTADFENFPEELKKYPELKGRTMLVKKAEPLPVECIVRGYLSGSAWLAYQKGKPISGIKLPAGLKESAKLEEPIFTPTTKAITGHDQEMTEREMENLVGKNLAKRLKAMSLKIYLFASKLAEKRGVIIADTKFEFGFFKKKLFLIDELLTPDSSRFWLKDEYSPGRPQKSFDKQYVRDYLIKIKWDKKPPAPELPKEIIEKTSQKYLEAYRKITGKKFKIC